jgi:sulfoxide reductase heme-binding subunit YedZ
LVLVVSYWLGGLAPDPIIASMRRTGRYALAFLLLSLVPTAVRILFGRPELLRVRRAIGLYAFFYALLHLAIYVGLDYAFDLSLIWLVVRDGGYVLLGFATFILMIPLAVTSTRGWMRRLGKNWRRLHRLAYVAAALDVIHYTWVYKELRLTPLLAAAALALLYLLRLPPVADYIERQRAQGRT